MRTFGRYKREAKGSLQKQELFVANNAARASIAEMHSQDLDLSTETRGVSDSDAALMTSHSPELKTRS
jgi:hypothetical protein